MHALCGCVWCTYVIGVARRCTPKAEKNFFQAYFIGKISKCTPSTPSAPPKNQFLGSAGRLSFGGGSGSFSSFKASFEGDD